MLDDVLVTSLSYISNDSGSVMHMLRADSPHFEKFGEIYFSTITPGCVKGWHSHHRNIQNFTVPKGTARFTLFDDRSDSATKDKIVHIEIGIHNYVLLRLPPKVWYCFNAIGPEPALIANCTTEPYDPEESRKRDLSHPLMPSTPNLPVNLKNIDE